MIVVHRLDFAPCDDTTIRSGPMSPVNQIRCLFVLSCPVVSIFFVGFPNDTFPNFSRESWTISYPSNSLLITQIHFFINILKIVEAFTYFVLQLI